MGTCWYCYWGWAKPVAEIYKEALIRLQGDSSPLHYGGSHIVWEDENFEDRNVLWCLEQLKEHRADYSDYTDEDLEIVKWSLNELMKIPENIRCPVPENYDDEHPELFPPTTETIRV
jgi:hypothetical protein